MILQAQGLCKSFPTPTGRLDILRNLDLSLAPGEAIAVLGASGSGKSTLLNIFGTLDKPDSGSLTIGGVPPGSLQADQLARFRNEKIGFVFQEHRLLPQLSALENVLIPAMAGWVEGNHSQRARELLDRVGLGGRLNHRPAELSGGERQRVAIARALLMGPKLILADEPTGNLDPTSAKSVGVLLREMVGADCGLVLVTHSVELAQTMPRVFRLQNERLEEGTL
jgi:lipoprotein-releasing system ATP-binding protein